MEFKKYCSIENTYREKEIGFWLAKYPELLNEQYIIEEKIHGSNFSIWMNKDGYKLGKRTSFLEEDENFFGYQQLKPLFEEIYSRVKKLIFRFKEINEIVLYGELYGNGVQKGVYYSDKKDIAFFDISINGEFAPSNIFVQYAKMLEIKTVPILGYAKNLDEALQYNIELNSKLSDKEFGEKQNIIEGIVIKPYYKVYQNGYGSMFYLKKKNDKFKEKQREPKVNKNNKISDEILELNKIFQTYLTETRVDNVISKYGEITSEKEIGKYLNLVKEDAKQEFLKDYPKEYDKTELKQICKHNLELSKIIMNKII